LSHSASHLFYSNILKSKNYILQSQHQMSMWQVLKAVFIHLPVFVYYLLRQMAEQLM
jgi:hypothetical protein